MGEAWWHDGGKWETMGSLVVKLDAPTYERLKNRHHYSDVDVINGHSMQSYSDELPMLYDVDAVKAAIRNILMWRVGESVIRPEFGHNLKKSMYSQVTDFNKEQICQEVKRAIETNEPRVEILSVDAWNKDEDEGSGQDGFSNAIEVKVAYQVRGRDAGDVQVVQGEVSGI